MVDRCVDDGSCCVTREHSDASELYAPMSFGNPFHALLVAGGDRVGEFKRLVNSARRRHDLFNLLATLQGIDECRRLKDDVFRESLSKAIGRSPCEGICPIASARIFVSHGASVLLGLK